MIRTFVRSSSARRLSIERLESRQLMAGDVAVAVVEGMLQVTGDAADNDVQIRMIPQTVSGTWPGAKYEITGASHNNTTPATTINGQDSVIVEGVKTGANIDLGEGNNFLRISRTGNNPTDYRAAAVPGPVTINTGAGKDLLWLYLQNHAQVTVNSGSGDDRIDIHRSTLYNLTVNADSPDPNAQQDWGQDLARIGASVVRGATNVYMGPDHMDASDSLAITYGSEFDGGFHFEGLASSLYWYAGDSGSQVKGPVNLTVQFVTLEHVHVTGSLTVTGNDRMSGGTLTDVTVSDELSLYGLGDADYFGLKDVQSPTTLIDGGDGNDTYRDYGGNSLGEVTFTSVENIETG
jgi:hypothetical protein